MKKLFTLLLCLLPVALFGATGDILSVTVETNGWSAQITIEGKTTNGTYTFGLSGNNAPTAPAVTLHVTSMGYDSTGSPITVQRIVYGTRQLRYAYPNDAYNWEDVSGGNVVIRIALSEFVFAKDSTNLTADIAANWYTQSGGNNAVTGIAVTDNSTMSYPHVVANWSWPSFELAGSSLTNRCTAFEHFGKFGMPVRVVKFTTTDGSSTVTNFITNPTIDRSMGDSKPVVEYIDIESTSPFTQGATLTRNFIAYPWVGDSTSVMDSSDGTAQPTPLIGPIFATCDKTGSYGRSFVLIDATNGNDATGYVTNNFTTNGLPLPFLTMAAGYNKILTYNNANYSRNNGGGSIMYLTNGTHTYVNGSANAQTINSNWFEIQGIPGSTYSQVIIGNKSGDGWMAYKTKLTGITATGSDGSGTFSVGSDPSELWFDQCNINSASGVFFYINTVWYMTRSEIPSLSMGLRPFSTVNSSPAIIRGNTFNGFSGSIFPYVMVGNSKTDNSSSGIDIMVSYSGQSIPACDNQIIAFNSLLGMNVSSGSAWNNLTPNTIGYAFVQNVLENFQNTSGPLFQAAADGSVDANGPVVNLICWNNTFIGQRENQAYNDTTANNPLRTLWSWKNNIEYDDNIKTDNTVAVGANSARTNNWSCLYGVGYAGNLIGDSGNGFAPEFTGLNTLYHTWTADFGAYIKAVNYAGWIGSGSGGAGQGNYRMQSSSPSMVVGGNDYLLPFDINGNNRSAIDPPGAYVDGNARKGSFF